MHTQLISYTWLILPELNSVNEAIFKPFVSQFGCD